MMKKSNMQTVKVGPRIEATVNAWNNTLYRDTTRNLFPLIIEVINNLRYNCGLNLPHRDIIIFKPIKSGNKNICHGVHFSKNGKIFIDPRRGLFDIVSTIAHELVHEEQHNTGKLMDQFINGKWIKEWNGQRYQQPTNFGVNYRSLPWEEEAFSRQFDLAIKALEFGRIVKQ